MGKERIIQQIIIKSKQQRNIRYSRRSLYEKGTIFAHWKRGDWSLGDFLQLIRQRTTWSIIRSDIDHDHIERVQLKIVLAFGVRIYYLLSNTPLKFTTYVANTL
jgi:hypothetical protein